MDNKLKTLVYMRGKVLQKGRVAFKNRLEAINRGDSVVDEGEEALMTYWYEQFSALEADADEQIQEAAASHPIIEQAVEVKGAGFITLAKIVAHIDIRRANTISALWRYAGLAVVDGKAERLKKGEKAHFNRDLKTAVYLLGTQFLKANSPYRQIYDEAKAGYEEKKPDWTNGHRHLAAMRVMMKVFLSHLWLRWRELEGLPVSEPYIIAHDDKHTHMHQPEDFGWPKEEDDEPA